MLYRGADPAAPAIGDIRIRYTAVPSQTMSVIAAQAGNTLAPYSAANGYRIALADPGVVPAAAMFREKAQEESLLTWILRAVGFVLMLIGLLLMASPDGAARRRSVVRNARGYRSLHAGLADRPAADIAGHRGSVDHPSPADRR